MPYSVLALSTIRDDQLRNLIRISDKTGDPRATDTILNKYVNQSIRYMAGFIENPRKFTNLAAVLGQSKYTVPTDTMLIRTAYFGDVTVLGDVRPLTLVTEETLSETKRGWLEVTTQNQGRPRQLFVYDRTTIFVDPAPDALSAVSGKNIILGTVYVPAELVSDSDTCDLPLIYQDIIQFYAASLFYLSTENPTSAGMMETEFNTKLKSLQATASKEIRQQGFQWGYDEVNFDNEWGIVFN